MCAYDDDRVVGDVTSGLVAQGHEVFQIYKSGASDRDHIEWLLDRMSPCFGASILDIGCGVGAVASLMSDARPDLRFTLMNKSQAQVGMCPPEFPSVIADMNDIPYFPRPFDAAMALYSLGHGDLAAVMAGAARSIRRGGVFFVYDLEGREIPEMGYNAHRYEDVASEASRCGFTVTDWGYPLDVSPDRFFDVMPKADFEVIFAGIRPVFYRMVKS
jgi:hypothetical protein